LTPAQLEEQNIRANLIWQEHQRQQEEARLQQMATRRWQEEEEARLS